MSSPSPQSVKRDFGLQHGRMTLPPSSPASPGANYIGATSNTLPLSSSTPMQRDTLQYKITWTDKVRNVFRFKKKKKDGFTTDPDIENYPQPFSRASGPVVHSTPKLFDPTKSLDNLDIGHHSSDDDMPMSLDDDITPGKLLTAEADDSGQLEETKRDKLTKEANKRARKQSSHTETSSELAADSSLVEHDDSTGQNTSNRTQSPSDLSESSVKESSSRQFSSDISSSEDEQDGNGVGQRKISAMTSTEWQQQIIAQNKKKKKRTRSIDNKRQLKIIERPLSAGNSSSEALSRTGTPENKLSRNLSDGVTSDSENRRSKKKKQGRVKGPHKSRENLGRPTILDADLKHQPEDQQTEESRDESEQEFQQEATNEKEDTVDFTAIPGGARKLSLQAAHDKRNAARNIKRRRATTKRSLFLHQNEQAKYGTDLVDPCMVKDSVKSQKVRKAEQIVQHLRRTQSPPSRPTSASMVAKAAEQKRLSGENTPTELVDPAREFARTDSKKRFSMSLLINKQILDSPVKPLPSISPKPRPKETNFLEHVKLKPIQNSPVKGEQNGVSSPTTENVTKPSGPPTRSKPRRLISSSDDKPQGVASVKKNGNKEMEVKLAPVKFEKNDKPTDKKVTKGSPAQSTKDTHLPPISENRRSVKGRRNKTVAQPVKAIGYMKEVPPSSSNKPAWIEIAQRKTQRVSEALHSTDRLPQLSTTPTKHTTNTKNTSPENEMSKESGLPVDGYVRRRLRTFSQDQETS